MATKIIELAGIGPVTLIKRRGNRSLRLSVTPTGVRVSLPTWTPYSAGQAFALSHAAWIQAELAKHTRLVLENGQRIGKEHYLRFEYAFGPHTSTSRVTKSEVVVAVLSGEEADDPNVQARAQKAAIRALKREAEQQLPSRLQALAAQHGKTYSIVAIKQLKRRWGSCDSKGAIALNLFLMELPWEFIDYVLLHELAHTVEMNHSAAFWRSLIAMEPRARQLAKALRAHQPTLGTWQP